MFDLNLSDLQMGLGVRSLCATTVRAMAGTLPFGVLTLLAVLTKLAYGKHLKFQDSRLEGKFVLLLNYWVLLLSGTDSLGMCTPWACPSPSDLLRDHGRSLLNPNFARYENRT